MSSKSKDLVAKKSNKSPKIKNGLIEDLRQLIEKTRQSVALAINSSLTVFYWKIGHRIRSEILLVVANAPTAYIYQETCAKVIHYRAESWRDFLPRCDKSSAKLEKDSIFTLASHSKASAFDHEFISPTYQERLRWHITNYIQNEGKML